MRSIWDLRRAFVGRVSRLLADTRQTYTAISPYRGDKADPSKVNREQCLHDDRKIS